MTETDLKRVLNYYIYPRDPTLNTGKGVVIINNGTMGGTHWTCFCIKDNELIFFIRLVGCLTNINFNI